ncbi:MAG: pilus assembly protein PilB, partial [Burkholderiales bacterium]|nr:pilus assembly protein PilB [Burkholderiales bacterium]
TNSAPETVTRLLDIGMDPFNFGDSLLVVLAQRLVRRLCTECRISEPASQAFIDELLDDYLYNVPAGVPALTHAVVLSRWVEQFGHNGKLMLHHNKGCERCTHTRFKGRSGIHELMSISKDLRRLIQTGARAEELQQQAMREGMRTLRQDGIDKVLAGVTSLDEVRATSNR